MRVVLIVFTVLLGLVIVGHNLFMWSVATAPSFDAPIEGTPEQKPLMTGYICTLWIACAAASIVVRGLFIGWGLRLRPNIGPFRQFVGTFLAFVLILACSTFGGSASMLIRNGALTTAIVVATLVLLAYHWPPRPHAEHPAGASDQETAGA